jgi:hypothetical protein
LALDSLKNKVFTQIEFGWQRLFNDVGLVFYSVEMTYGRGEWKLEFTKLSRVYVGNVPTSTFKSKNDVLAVLMAGYVSGGENIMHATKSDGTRHTLRSPEDFQRLVEKHWAERFAAAARGAATRRRIRLGQLPEHRAAVRAELAKNLAYVPAYTRGGRVPRGFQGGSQVRENTQSLFGVTPDGYGGFVQPGVQPSAQRQRRKLTVRFAPGTKTHNGTQRGGGPGNYPRQELGLPIRSRRR